MEPADVVDLLTRERLRSYFHAVPDDARAVGLYEWNMRAAAAVMELTGAVEIVVRNAADVQLCAWATARHPGSSWLDVVPLDAQGKNDLVVARRRATRGGNEQKCTGESSPN